MTLLSEAHVRERMCSRLAEAECERRSYHVVALRRAERKARKAKARLARPLRTSHGHSGRKPSQKVYLDRSGQVNCGAAMWTGAGCGRRRLGSPGTPGRRAATRPGRGAAGRAGRRRTRPRSHR
ncbi:MAG: hypothetical protein GEV04_24815 [Actinophytocola sp.]|nr:hypothetical protein [Actinophytocola sp.]